MDDQDQFGGSSSEILIASDNRICLDIGAQSLTGFQLKEIYTSVDDYAPKVRKPYTITKQREKWTEEEHKKFLEALKLYGRSWRKIEEHVGTKTAVQIRSHAQKFFSKVVRESNGSNERSLKSIEIPPPRPKRKPMHPYPRKLAHSVRKETSVPMPPERALFPNLSVLVEEENQSPKSVLSEVGSDTLGSMASDPQNSTPSSVSSASGGGNPARLLLITEQKNGYVTSASSVEEENGDSSSVLVTANSTPEDQSLMKIDSSSKDGVCSKGNSEAPTMSFKLFGRTVLVTDSCSSSSPNPETHKSSPSESCPENPQIYDGRVVQTSPWDPLQTGFSQGTDESAWIPWTCGAPPVLYYTPTQKQDLKSVEAASPVPLPWWASYSGLPFPFLSSVHKTSTTAPSESCLEQVQEEESKKEGSWTDSNTASVCVMVNGEKNCYVLDSESREPSPNKEGKESGSVFRLKPSASSAFYELRSNSDKPMKGFMPYKRCLAERDTRSSTITEEEREGQRIRIC